MKKLIIMSLGLMALSLISCKKDRDCECTTTTTTVLGNASETETVTLVDVSKGTAKRACVSSTSTNPNYTVKSECKLK